MSNGIRFTTLMVTLALAAGDATAQQQAEEPSSPADGYTIHVTAPHIYQGHRIGPVHHWCKPVTEDPIIVCLLFSTGDANAPMHGVEYIVPKSLTRPSVSLGTWNSNFHDHAKEIATGNVKVLDVSAEQAKEIADLVATTDGIIFHLWPEGDRFPTGTVVIDQAVGHEPLSEAEYRRTASRSGADR